MKDISMKPTPCVWLKVVCMGFALTAHAYAASLDDEAKQAVMDYVLSRNIMAICDESFAFAPHAPQGLHRCEVCMSFQRGELCRLAFSTDLNTATLTARNTACTFLAHSSAEEMACSQTPPARVTCSQPQAEALEQRTGFDITINQEKVSSAEKRQLIQWKGTGSLEVKERRTSSPPTWSPGPSMPTKLHVTILKEKGHWIVHPN